MFGWRGPGARSRGSPHPSARAALARAHEQSKGVLRRSGKEADRETLVFRHFGGLYFSYLQSVQLNALLTLAHRQRGPLRDCILAAIISTASEVVNTVGKHFAQPIKPRSGDGCPKNHLLQKILRDRRIDVPSLFAD